jgi:hypothetical protein
LRVCFRSPDGNAHDVEIVDYHEGVQVPKPFAVHPGEILLTEFMEPLSLTSYRLARS